MYERVTATHWICTAMLVGMIYGVATSSTPVVCFCGFIMVCGQLALVGDVLLKAINGRTAPVD